MAEPKAEPKIEHLDILRLARAIREIVKLHIKYLKLGSSISAIAEMFSKLYLRELCNQMDEDALGKVNVGTRRVVPNQGAMDRTTAAESVCLRISSAFIAAISEMITRKSSR